MINTILTTDRSGTNIYLTLYAGTLTLIGESGERGKQMLTEQKEKAITMLIKGESRTDIAKSIGVVRKTIYEWLKDDEFGRELESRRKEIIKSGNDFIIARTSTYLEALNDLATTSSDARTKASVLMYLVDRSLGKTAQRLELEPIELTKVPTRQELESEFADFKNKAIIADDSPEGNM